MRQGVYGDYEMDLPTQVYDDAESKFKSAKETKKKKAKYTALLGILVMGSFVIPMGQYFWYVRDDTSSEDFFSAKLGGLGKKAEEPPPPPPPPKKGFKNPFARD